MATADFAIVKFNEHLGDDPGDLNAPAFTFVHNLTTLKHFDVPGVPTGPGYLIMQTVDVQSLFHEILINNTELPGVDIIPTAENQYGVDMDVIPERRLQRGDNTIQIRRAKGGDNILIGNVMIHWKQTLKVEKAQHAVQADEAEHAQTAKEADHAKTADKLSPSTPDGSVSGDLLTEQ